METRKEETPTPSHMSVSQMGLLLGLKKTGRYWLFHKGYFETDMIAGRMQINIKSFEEWYSHQLKYHKVTGEEPGQALREKYYLPSDIAKILNISEHWVSEVMRNTNIDWIQVDYWRIYSKDSFNEWLANQKHYRNSIFNSEKDDEIVQKSISMPEMARMLGISRSSVYGILNRTSFEYIFIGDQKRILKESFYRWYLTQDTYRIVPDNSLPLAITQEKQRAIEVYRRQRYDLDQNSKNIGTETYLTLDEAALLAGTTISSVSKWIRKKNIPSIRYAGLVRVQRKGFEEFLQKRKEMQEQWLP